MTDEIASVPRQDPPPQRLRSLDAYRGLIMMSLSFVGFGLAKTAANHLQVTPDSEFWETVRFQFSHVQWVGCAFWDLIQPSFMFMVGVDENKLCVMGEAYCVFCYLSTYLVILNLFHN